MFSVSYRSKHMSPTPYLLSRHTNVLVFSAAKQDYCGEWVTALCPYGEDGCPDSEGDYDVVMPEPMEGKEGHGYKVRNNVPFPLASV